MIVTSPLTANVWKVLVSPGDTVAEGAELAILESMKMEIPVESPCAGVVKAVLCAPDDAVNDGQALFEVEKIP